MTVTHMDFHDIPGRVYCLGLGLEREAYSSVPGTREFHLDFCCTLHVEIWYKKNSKSIPSMTQTLWWHSDSTGMTQRICRDCVTQNP